VWNICTYVEIEASKYTCAVKLGLGLGLGFGFGFWDWDYWDRIGIGEPNNK
jgi:hypothetical protein